MKRIVQDHIRASKKMYLFLSLLFAAGAFIGTLVIRYLSKDIHSLMIKDLAAFFSESLQMEKEFSRTAYFKMNALLELKIYFVMWLCGLTVLGFAAAPFFALWKGFVLGFANSFLIMHYRISGFFYDLLTILPQNLIKVPALFFACATILSYAIKLSEKRSSAKSVSSGQLFLLYSFSMVCAFAFSMLGVLFESFVTPSLIFVFSPEML
ncbi:MAG: stage II sporulation protein M [Eubacteriaceae bacterium]|nr:stage II sporulation protein M [Eubacteriaceae bacterium]